MVKKTVIVELDFFSEEEYKKLEEKAKEEGHSSVEELFFSILVEEV